MDHNLCSCIAGFIASPPFSSSTLKEDISHFCTLRIAQELASVSLID